MPGTVSPSMSLPLPWRSVARGFLDDASPPPSPGMYRWEPAAPRRRLDDRRGAPDVAAFTESGEAWPLALDDGDDDDDDDGDDKGVPMAFGSTESTPPARAGLAETVLLGLAVFLWAA